MIVQLRRVFVNGVGSSVGMDCKSFGWSTSACVKFAVDSIVSSS